MRDLLFRGKKVKPSVFDKTDWVYGSLIDSGNHEQVSIYPWYDGASTMTIRQLVYARMEAVKPETVGQFTGLTDKNGKEIFEGDIVKQTFEKTVAIATADFWGGDEYADLYGEDVGVVVILPSKGTCIKNPVIHREVDGEITQDGEVAKMYKNICSGRCEVIGTIHDNPELVEVSK